MGRLSATIHYNTGAKVNFLLDGLTFLRYYAPVALEASRRGHACRFFIKKSNKYNCPYVEKNMNMLLSFCEPNGFSIHSHEELHSYPGLCFLIEGGMVEFLGPQHHSVSLTYMTDFRFSYEKYIDAVDNVIFPSELFAQHYNTISDKNLYLGSPKYDFESDPDEVYKSYNLSKENKYCLIIYPKLRDLHKVDIEKVIQIADKLGYTSIIKHREKDKPRKKYNCKTYGDFRWFPHTTLDLLTVSDIVINTGSTTVKEAVMKQVPILNFNIKSHHEHLVFLYDHNFCINQKQFSDNELLKSMDHLTTNNFDAQFTKCKKDQLFVDNSTNKILDYFNV